MGVSLCKAKLTKTDVPNMGDSVQTNERKQTHNELKQLRMINYKLVTQWVE